jgi:hypothetical protein
MKGIKSGVTSDPNVREQVRNYSRQTYCHPVEEINAQMAADFAVAPPVAPPPVGSNGPLNNL